MLPPESEEQFGLRGSTGWCRRGTGAVQGRYKHGEAGRAGLPSPARLRATPVWRQWLYASWRLEPASPPSPCGTAWPPRCELRPQAHPPTHRLKGRVRSRTETIILGCGAGKGIGQEKAWGRKSQTERPTHLVGALDRGAGAVGGAEGAGLGELLAAEAAQHARKDLVRRPLQAALQLAAALRGGARRGGAGRGGAGRDEATGRAALAAPPAGPGRLEAGPLHSRRWQASAAYEGPWAQLPLHSTRALPPISPAHPTRPNSAA